MGKRTTTLLLLIISLLFAGCEKENDNGGKEVIFKDSRFKELCLKLFDSDGDGVITRLEASQAEVLILTSEKITSLEGIQFFTSLKELDCSGNNIESVNLSKNTKLEKLNINFNSLGKLDVSRLTGLKELYCSGNPGSSQKNKLTKLDVSSNRNLEVLHCANNLLESLDLTNNTELRELGFGDNRVTSADISHLRKLKLLRCQYNKLTNLNLGEHPDLARLECGFNITLPEIDVSGCPELVALDVSGNYLKKLDVSRNAGLTTLYCVGCKLSAVNTSGNTKLRIFHCAENDLTDIDISGNKNIFSFDCHLNPIWPEDKEDPAPELRIRVWDSFNMENPPGNFRIPYNARYYK